MPYPFAKVHLFFLNLQRRVICQRAADDLVELNILSLCRASSHHKQPDPYECLSGVSSSPSVFLICALGRITLTIA